MSAQEAQYLLSAAYAGKKASHAAKRLACYRAKEFQLKAQLYRIRAEQAEAELRLAEKDVGRVRYMLRKSGHFKEAASASASLDAAFKLPSRRGK